MGRLDIEKQKELEPKRMEYARNQITALGYPVTEVKRHTLQFTFRGWGRCCCKSCAAQLREKNKPGYNPERVAVNNARR